MNDIMFWVGLMVGLALALGVYVATDMGMGMFVYYFVCCCVGTAIGVVTTRMGWWK